jgi:hypothetical protein
MVPLIESNPRIKSASSLGTVIRAVSFGLVVEPVTSDVGASVSMRTANVLAPEGGTVQSMFNDAAAVAGAAPPRTAAVLAMSPSALPAARVRGLKR